VLAAAAAQQVAALVVSMQAALLDVSLLIASPK
jgi:hypothetical protein